tara:strand:- start:10390 stop:10773 length:384 start_codon:yes stop_codon:yes gene_type:complete
MRMDLPNTLKYTISHEWVMVDGDTATVGITDYAQGELGDIIFIEVQDLGTKVMKGEPLGTIEAVKTVVDLMAPVSGEIVDINRVLEDSPQEINDDPYGEGWIVQIEISDSDEVEDLLSASEYEENIA